MMEMANGSSQGQDTISSPGVTSQPASPPTQAPTPATEERTFKQSEVNELIKKTKYGAVEDYKRLQSERPDYVQQKYGEETKHQPSTTQQAPSEQAYRQMAAEEAQRLRDEWVQEAQTKSQAEAAQKTVQNFWNKVSTGKEKYQDFEAVTGDIEFARFPNVVQMLAEHIENADEVLYEFGKDRIKMANLEQLSYMSPKDAIKQAQRLSQTLKDNREASKVRMPREPLNQMRPSNAGTDNGVMSVGDYRKKYKV